MHDTRRLAEFVADTRYNALPPEVIEATKVYILDNLASGLAGSATPWAAMVCDLAQKSGSPGPCTVLARKWGASPSYATLANGTMIGGFECDHAFVQGSAHPSVAVFPAALAVAQQERLNGAALLLSVALGYEVTCRIGMAATRAVEDVAGFHGPGTNAPFGGAAGAGKALGLDAVRLMNALGIAGSHGAGLLEFVKEGAMTKRLHVARGSQMGLESALLAARGFTGPSTVLEGERGFLRVYSPSPQPALLLENLGERFRMLEMTLKAYACHVSFHPVIEGICRARGKRLLEAGEVERVEVTGADWMMEPRFLAREPQSVLGAQYSLPFSVSLALCRRIEDPRAYSEANLWDTEVRALARRVALSTDEKRFRELGRPVAEVSLTVAGRTSTFTVSGWKGAPTDPYTYEEMADKFRRYAAPALPSSRIEQMVQRVSDLEGQQDVGELARLLEGT